MRRCNSPRFPDCDAPVKAHSDGLLTCLNGHSQVAQASDRRETNGKPRTVTQKRFSTIAADMGLDEMGLFCKLAREHESVVRAASSLGKHEMTLRAAVKRATGLGWGDFREKVLAGEIGSLGGNASPCNDTPPHGEGSPPGKGFIRYWPVKPHLQDDLTVAWSRSRAALGRSVADRIGERVDLFFNPATREVLMVPGKALAIIRRDKETRCALTVGGFNKAFGIDWRGQVQAEWSDDHGGFVVVLPAEAVKGAGG